MPSLFRKIMAACSIKRQNRQTMDIEMEDCASYASFCDSINTAKKSRFSSSMSDDSDSDTGAVDWENDADESDSSDISWTNDEQSCQEESMDDFDDIVFGETNESLREQVNAFWNQPYESVHEHERSSAQISQENNCDIEGSNDEQSTTVQAAVRFEIYLEEQSEKSGVLQKLNREWDEAHKDINETERTTTKVSFAPDNSLVEVWPADECDRSSEWMLYAIDRMRFQKRIEETEAILSPIFSKENRSKVSLELQIDVEQTVCTDSK